MFFYEYVNENGNVENITGQQHFTHNIKQTFKVNLVYNCSIEKRSKRNYGKLTYSFIWIFLRFFTVAFYDTIYQKKSPHCSHSDI